MTAEARLCVLAGGEVTAGLWLVAGPRAAGVLLIVLSLVTAAVAAVSARDIAVEVVE